MILASTLCGAAAGTKIGSVSIIRGNCQGTKGQSRSGALVRRSEAACEFRGARERDAQRRLRFRRQRLAERCAYGDLFDGGGAGDWRTDGGERAGNTQYDGCWI
jgi:hypothetical protein